MNNIGVMTNPFINPGAAITELEMMLQGQYNPPPNNGRSLGLIGEMAIGDALRGNWVVGNTEVIEVYVDVGHDIVALNPREAAKDIVADFSYVLQQLIQKRS